MVDNPNDLEIGEDEGLGEDQMISKARRLFELREQRDHDKQAAVQSEQAYRAFEQEFFQALADSSIEGALKIDLGEEIGVVRFSPRETYFGRLLDVDRAQDYFESRAMADEMFEPKVAKARLNDFVRECMDNDIPLPDGVDFYASRGITISRQKDK